MSGRVEESIRSVLRKSLFEVELFKGGSGGVGEILVRAKKYADSIAPKGMRSTVIDNLNLIEFSVFGTTKDDRKALTKFKLKVRDWLLKEYPDYKLYHATDRRKKKQWGFYGRGQFVYSDELKGYTNGIRIRANL